VVPSSLFKKLFDSHTLQSLTSVNLSDNSLQQIPTQLRSIDTLKSLTLAGNKLSIGFSAGLNNQVWAPCSLRILDLSNNGLTTEHAEIVLSSVTFISSVDFARNALDNVPRNITHVTALRELNLAFNKVTSLASTDFYELPQLEILNLSNNRLREVGLFPEDCRLRIVDFSNNDLSDVPYCFGFIETLQSLALQGNSIRLLRQAVINGPLEGLKQALRNKAP
jgi:Leucine-rich repeat (LRR) protein